MALSPVASEVDDRVIEAAPIVETSRTYDLFTTGLNGMIDGDAAIRQFIQKALVTARSTFMIYSDDYGCEIDTLIGQSVTTALFDVEVTRLIREAIIYDSRILSVGDFVITRSGDAVFVTFAVETLDGSLITEEAAL